MPGPDRDFTESRIEYLDVGKEVTLPEYPDLASAPNKPGLSVFVTGAGSDEAGAYTYDGTGWSGPSGGPSDLPDSVVTDGTTVANTEKYSFGEYLTGATAANEPKHVVADIDTAATDARYLRLVTDSFDYHAPTDPGTDQPTTPQTWTFIPGDGSTAVPGGYFDGDTPPSTQSARSFGVDFASTSAPDGRTISSGTWAIEKEYALGAGGGTLSASAWATPTATYAAYDDGMAHPDTETFVGEDDAFVAIEAYDSSLQALDLATTTAFSRTASHQAFAGGRTTDLGNEWVQFSHEATLPADAAFVRVRLQAADQSDAWVTRGAAGSGNAALLMDDYSASYTSGLRESAVLAHDHDGVYAGQAEFDSHAGDTTNPHGVTTGQIGAATASALSDHENDTNPHQVTASQAGAAPSGHDHSGDSLGDNSPLASINTEQLSGYHIIDPDTDDWGAAVNDILANLSGRGHTIITPPGDFDSSTTAVIDTEVALVGLGGHQWSYSAPTINKRADVRLIDTSERVYFSNLIFNGQRSDGGTTEGVRIEGNKIIADNVLVRGMGGDGIHIHQPSGVNQNVCRIDNLSVRSVDGDGVRITRESGATRNQNAWRINLYTAFDVAGWGINAGSNAFGNEYHIQWVEGGSTGGIRLDGNGSKATIGYDEGNYAGPTIQFDGPHNTGEVVFSADLDSSHSIYQDNDGRNYYELPAEQRLNSSGHRTANIGSSDTSGLLGEIAVPSGGVRWTTRVRAYGGASDVQAGGEFAVVKAQASGDVYVRTLDSWTSDSNFIRDPTVSHNDSTNRIEIAQQAAGGNSGDVEWQLSFEHVGSSMARFV